MFIKRKTENLTANLQNSNRNYTSFPGLAGSKQPRQGATLLGLPKLFIIKFPYNARSDWLKQRALSEIRERVDEPIAET